MKSAQNYLTDFLGLSGVVLRTAVARIFVALMVSSLLFLSNIPVHTGAYFTTCIANISPDSMSVGMSSTFNISITNGLSGPMQWIDINVPSGNYSYAGNSIGNGWTTSDHEGGTIVSGSAMDVGQTQDFPVVIVSGSEASSGETWSVRASKNADGSSPVDCTGSLQTSITGSLPQDTVNGVSGVTVADITDTVATIHWQTTNPSSSIVYFGESADYGSHSDFDDAFVVDHSALLTGLQPETTYHFQVVGADINGNYAHSIDNTFVTASQQPEQTEQPEQKPPLIQQQTNQNVSTSPTIIRPTFKTNPNDATPPTIASVTTLNGAYSVAPEMRVRARDNTALAYAEYSTDGGRNWLPAQAVAGIGSQDAEFSFTPSLKQDGSYSVMVRVFDAGGIVATSAAQTLVLDKLPPTVAGAILAIGPELLRPSANGMITLAEQQDAAITFSAVGGPTSITIEAVQTENTNVRQSFSLSRSYDSGLWSGALSFLHPGTYDLTVYAVDGAQNKTQKTLQKVMVIDPEKVTDIGSGHPVKAEITIMAQNPDTGQWIEWDGASYGRQNPLKSGDTGGYSLYVPAGQYYVKFTAPGYETIVTKKFEVNQPTLLSKPVRMYRQKAIAIGALRIVAPGTGMRIIDFDVIKDSPVTAVSRQVTDMPTDTMQLVDGSTIKPVELYGKPTVISFVSTWAPSAQEQLAILSKLDKTGVNVLAVVSGEPPARVKAYLQIAGYDVRVINDADNSMISRYGAVGLPSTYFMDRHGVIKRSTVGVLTSDQILTNIAEAL